MPRGLLLGATAAGALPLRADIEFGNYTFHLELLLVRLAAGRHDRILRQCQAAPLQILLKQSLGILAAGRGVDCIDRGAEQGAHHPPRRFETAIEKYRANDRFDRVRQHRWAPGPAASVLALAEQQ